MARRNRRLLIPEARKGLEHLKGEVMSQLGYRVDRQTPQDVKFEVAKQAGIDLKKDGNGELSTEAAGKIGGNIGGPIVREMIRRAQEALIHQQK